jgi:hypothetical protein
LTTPELYAAANAVMDEIQQRLRTCDWYHDLMRKHADLMKQWHVQFIAEEKAEKAQRKQRRRAR